jgi:hypothetical protein
MQPALASMRCTTLMATATIVRRQNIDRIDDYQANQRRRNRARGSLNDRSTGWISILLGVAFSEGRGYSTGILSKRVL